MEPSRFSKRWGQSACSLQIKASCSNYNSCKSIIKWSGSVGVSVIQPMLNGWTACVAWPVGGGLRGCSCSPATSSRWQTSLSWRRVSLESMVQHTWLRSRKWSYALWLQKSGYSLDGWTKVTTCGHESVLMGSDRLQRCPGHRPSPPCVLACTNMVKWCPTSPPQSPLARVTCAHRGRGGGV